jgi:uncharacterized membrane protein YfcA
VTGAEILLVVLAGGAAGIINTIVGSGTLITFPALLAIGLPPVVANMSNNVGILFGNASGAWGYRRELTGQRQRLGLLIPAALVGGLIGAAVLLVAPESAFELVVPVLVGLAVVLVLVQPRLQAGMAHRRQRQASQAKPVHGGRVGLLVGTALTGVYGGYFGAAQGVILLGLLGSLLPDSLQRVNGLKNVVVLAVNTVAALVFVAVAGDRVHWAAAGLVAASSLVGGWAGARLGRRLPAPALRAVIVVVGLATLVRLVLTS